MMITYDPEADAACIYFVQRSPGMSKRTVPMDIDDHMFAFDFDEMGHLIYIEVMDASSVLPESLLKTASRP